MLGIKYGHVCKPTIVKAYICVFVSLTVKAVHLELVTDLTSEAFLACLRRFIARRGIPSLVCSDNGTNFVGAARELKELYQFLKYPTYRSSLKMKLHGNLSHREPHTLEEAAVKSVKYHLRKILGDVKLTYEEFSTVLAQIEACLNSRPLAALPDDDGIEALTPGHFLIGKPLTALPDLSTPESISMLKRW